MDFRSSLDSLKKGIPGRAQHHHVLAQTQNIKCYTACSRPPGKRCDIFQRVHANRHRTRHAPTRPPAGEWHPRPLPSSRTVPPPTRKHGPKASADPPTFAPQRHRHWPASQRMLQAQPWAFPRHVDNCFDFDPWARQEVKATFAPCCLPSRPWPHCPDLPPRPLAQELRMRQMRLTPQGLASPQANSTHTDDFWEDPCPVDALVAIPPDAQI